MRKERSFLRSIARGTLIIISAPIIIPLGFVFGIFIFIIIAEIEGYYD